MSSKKDIPNREKIARILRSYFDLSFGSRRWVDLPDGEPERWLEIAADFVADYKNPDWSDE